MISLKRHMDRFTNAPAAPPVQEPEVELSNPEAALYRSLVATIAANSARACAATNEDFQKQLRPMRERMLAEQTSIPAEVARRVEREVDNWGAHTSNYYAQKAAEIGEMMLAMMDATKSVGERDQKYNTQFHEVSARLQSIGTLEDLTQIRYLVNQTASELRTCAERMVEDGAQSIAGLRAQLATYEKRVVETQKLAETDTLTGLANRAGVEQALELRICGSRKFSLLVCDLNGFKDLNDRHGHLVGDELLKQFGAELRAQFRPSDIIGRWGGDEFVAILDETDPTAVATRVDSIRKWTFGNYTVRLSEEPLKVNLTAAVGVAAWRTGMTAADVFRLADKAMYVDKGQRSRTPAES